MSSEVVVNVEGVSKKYCKSLRRSMMYGMGDISRNMIGRSSHPEILRRDEFWAVNNVSFELKRGEALGIVGSNGSGKTTLLKMLNGIFMPDQGRIAITGRVGALIAVGAGFHPVLTGRENIYVNGAILGMTRQEIKQNFDSIVAFADIGEFLDTPVKYYSSGMFVRLGFAIAVHCKPDILLIDEVLAVGDATFRAKCYNRIGELLKEAAVVLVSHDMGSIARICPSSMHLNKGVLGSYGRTEKVLYSYLSQLNTEEGRVTVNGVNLTEVDIRLPQVGNEYRMSMGDTMALSLTVSSELSVVDPNISIDFISVGGDFVGQWSSKFNCSPLSIKKGFQKMEIRVDSINLSPGVYDVSIIVTAGSANHVLYWNHRGFRVGIEGGFYSNSICQFKGNVRLNG